MADTKISDLADGTTPDTADVFPAARAGANVKLSWAELIAAASVPPASALATHEADTTNIHGITDTAALETTTGAQSKADAAQAASQPVDSDLTAIAALTTTVYGRALLALADAAAARTALALGTAATAATGDFDAAGAASAAQAASQPLDSDLTAIAALTTTSYGRAFLALADAAAGQTALGLGTLATQSGTFSGTSSGTNTGDQDLSGLQPLDSDLTAFAGLAIASDKLPYGTGSHTLGLADFTAAARTVLDDTTVGAMRTTLGVPTAVGGVEWTVVTKAGDASVSSSTTPALDGDLKFTSVSGAMYEFEFVVVYGSPAGAGTPDIALVVGEDTTIRGAAQFLGLTISDVSSNTVNNIQTNASSTTRGTAATNRVCRINGQFDGGGGTFGLLWAQASSSGNATIVRAGSVLRYRRIV